MASLKHAAPQFLVDDLERSLAFYRERLGFGVDFVYDGFYASVSRDGARIHLKCAPKLEAERAHRRDGVHLDAHVEVVGVRELHEELRGRGVSVGDEPRSEVWGTLDFTVEDPDGYLVCFSEPL